MKRLLLTEMILGCGVAMFVGLASLPGLAQESAKPKFTVKIADEKAVVVNLEDSGAIDPTPRINFQQQRGFPGFYINIRTIQNQTLHLSHFPSFLINGRFYQQAQGGRFEIMHAPLDKKKGDKKRVGFYSVWVIDGLRITQTLELYPSKAKKPGEKRLSNNVLVTYLIENKGQQTVPIGVRNYIDTYIIDNDGCLFASPVTHPGKILDGMILKEKTMPPFIQLLQRPNLKEPGYVAYLSFNVGSKYEKANKLVLTRHGAGFNSFDMPAIASMGDSGLGFFWATKDMKPGARRELAYVYGEGIAVSAENEGRYQISLGGSFEPGKVATISALVADPAVGQTLALDLPKGIQLLEGRRVQPVAVLSEDQEYSAVLWKVRVTEPGQHAVRVRSSTGVTQTKIVTVTAEK
ncbi:MAG: hypothetical protein HYX68_16190 [Planctomycetes bacterium]|nr:hypothetical protein [Planctomycetota bacterium]